MTDAPLAELEPGLMRLRAPNPSPMTGPGTNSYVVGHARLAIIDPGPDDPAHLRALLSVIGGRPVEAILVTHAHLDHSALAPALARATGAPVCGYGPATAGRSAVMRRLADAGIGGGEGLDDAFAPDMRLGDGARVTLSQTPLTALHLPGHMAGHLCFDWCGAVFSGDLVMGWSSTLISPPDGDLAAFRRSCDRLRAHAPRRLYPGHGDPIDAPGERIDWLLAHRAAREAQIRAALRDGPLNPAELTRRLYAELPATLHPAARRNVLAHLIDLMERNLVTPSDGDLDGARFTLT
ncbi:MBL fold metallo-hydrolase [Limimaricola litoreus]|uniref:MBL fold metallo-hydrolase n=1 Tax=Limimaricola litoreus TaxID=2955316 RepID=A0A9X2JQI9_9RHOB|nr:MBL fold metallo-hydrolase [Limimaricola litoreus]MCP1167671.1 MBL fold metallo-hydrolase [Limimaricola litoreus]